MTVRKLAAAAIFLALVACGSDSYESVSRDIDALMGEKIPVSAEDEARVAGLRERAEELQRAGQSEESVEVLKEARGILEKAKDADLLRKSEG